ncbi:caspase Dronc-like [Cochliomyia hominivorax]
MDDNDRELIIKNIDSLVNLTDFKTLHQYCVLYGLLTDVMVHNIYHADLEKLSTDSCDEIAITRERHKRLFLKITKRGPDALKKLQLIFKDLKYKEASKLLFGTVHSMISISLSKPTLTPTSGENDDHEEDNDVENIQSGNVDDRDGIMRRQFSRTFSNDNEISLDQYNGVIKPKKYVNVRKATKISKHPSIETYPMESKSNRGVFFMVNIVDFTTEPKRKGADEDTHSLLSLFKQLDFKLYAYTNISQKEFFERLDMLLKSDVIKDTECFVMALMTHGILREGIQWVSFNDGSVAKVEDIEKRFYHENCPHLMHKPKIFIFPFCRGDIPDRGVVIPNKTQTDSIGTSAPITNNVCGTLSDVMICYATVAGFESHRDVEDGSWYVQKFVDTMAEHACDIPFEEMLKIVQSDISKLRTENNELQTANYANIGFNKILYFNPGVFRE